MNSGNMRRVSPLPGVSSACFGGIVTVATLVLLAAGLQACSGSRELRQYMNVRGTDTYTRDPSLAESLDKFLPDTLFPPANIGLVIGTLDDGRIVYQRNADMLFTPASNQKLVTSAAALSTLGPLHEFRTDVAIDSEGGTIYLRGGGDPILTTADLETLADSTIVHLPYRPTWTVVADPTRFDTIYWGRGWMWDDAGDPSGMSVAGLSVNANTIDLLVQAGDSLGKPPAIAVSPPDPLVTIINNAVVADSVTEPLEAVRSLQHPSNTVTVTGTILRQSRRTLSVAVWEPERYAATLFAAALRRFGVHVAEISVGTTPGGAWSAATVTHRLDSIVTYMNKVSDNLSAECLVKTMGARSSSGAGTWREGTHAVRQFLDSLHIDTLNVVVADGSGLSRYNLTTAGTLFRLLEAMYRTPTLWPVYAASLPIAGQDGTLEYRMRGTNGEGMVHAKTGSISGVSSLTGFIETVGGRPLGFSMIMENVPGSVRPLRAVQDSIAAYLVTYRPPSPSLP
jgi:D-alanyl-D-alanine carboxypeptidase/D-alanyl-D-alanine-endopeptidase (penicillin-binding protein 4)